MKNLISEFNIRCPNSNLHIVETVEGNRCLQEPKDACFCPPSNANTGNVI